MGMRVRTMDAEEKGGLAKGLGNGKCGCFIWVPPDPEVGTSILPRALKRGWKWDVEWKWLANHARGSLYCAHKNTTPSC